MCHNLKVLKKKTFRENYGVDNIFQADFFKEISNATMMKKYGQLSVSTYHNRHKDLTDEKRAELYKNLQLSYWKWYNSLSEEELLKLQQRKNAGWRKYYDSLTSEERTQKMKHLWNGNISKLEIRIQTILSSLLISYSTQFEIKKKFFDIKIINTKIIIEVNGDYWHCNPNLYNSDDLVNFPDGTKIASSIWERDKKKNLLASEQGYKVVLLWESEIKCRTDEELETLLLEKINNGKNSNN
ncbi:MAG: hypothetical protein DRH57_01470 [Candidatus Cloacimonadota bacterium]|nr:MAG: hypothetical protein DRH57_01470 [Candidatus Cloacimonadota bacterium]